MPTRTHLPPLDDATRAALVACYNHAADPELRTRCQMVLLASDRALGPDQIAPLVLRSHDTVLRVLHRFQQGGLRALPRRAPPGGPPTITPAWLSELARIMELEDPRAVGVESAIRTTPLPADHLAGVTGIAVDPETVRRALHRLGYVYKRPGWTLAHRAHERADYVGNACGWSCS